MRKNKEKIRNDKRVQGGCERLLLPLFRAAVRIRAAVCSLPPLAPCSLASTPPPPAPPPPSASQAPPPQPKSLSHFPYNRDLLVIYSAVSIYS